MPSFCSAYGCANKSCYKKCIEQKISFHRFPLKNPEILKQWLVKIKRDNFQPNEFSKLCSTHFEEKDFVYQPFTNVRQLKPGSVPSKFCFQKPSKRKRISYLDRSSQNETAKREVKPSKRKQLDVSKLRSDPQALTEVETDKALAASYSVKDDVNTIQDVNTVSSEPKKRLRSSKGLDESLFWDFIDGAVVTHDGKFKKKVSPGCATIAAHWHSSEKKNPLHLSNNLSPENFIKYEVQVCTSEENGLAHWKNYVETCKSDSVKSRSPKLLKQELNLAQCVIDEMKLCIKRLKAENKKLHSEKENPLIRNLHCIKQDATESELDAIILLNQIASYSEQHS